VIFGAAFAVTLHSCPRALRWLARRHDDTTKSGNLFDGLTSAGGAALRAVQE